MSEHSKIEAIKNKNLLSYFIPKGIKASYCIIAVLSSSMLAFGLYNVHSISGVTEGGVLGLTLFLEYWFKISPATSGFILNTICYILGWKLLGKKFIFYSFIASAGFSISYRVFEMFDPLFPQLAKMPFVAAIIGALFVGISAGLCVKIGGAPGGDDALAMSISKVINIDIQWAYMLCDIVVLGLSLSYIPLNKIIYSLITVTISGQIVGIIQKINFKQ